MLTIIKNTNHKIKHTKKSGMKKLRNIGYLRFGSKILQGFAGFFTSLTPPLSLSPLWNSWTGNEGAREGAQLLYLGGGSLLPPCRAGGLPAAPPPGGRCLPPGKGAAGSREGPLRKNNLYLFTYRSMPPPCRAVGV